jgi:thiol-disulfide isomerase/thioredoxin
MIPAMPTPNRSPRLPAVVLAGALALAAGAHLAGCAGGRPALRASPLLGEPLEVAAPDLAGREVRLSGPSGKVRVVDFWATWCEPCREQMPFLDRLAREHGERGLEVYAVAFDEDAMQVRQFVEEVPVGFPVLWDQGGARHSEKLDITRLPTTIVAGRDGRIRFVHLGYDPVMGERLAEEVKVLLAE